MRRLAYLLLFFTLLGALVAGLGYWLLDRPTASPAAIRLRMPHLDSPLAEHDLAGGLPLPGSSRADPLGRLSRPLRGAIRQIRGLGKLYIPGCAFGGSPKAQELRRQLTLLRESGKSVDCCLETAGEVQTAHRYYLASACSDIALAPAGEINLLGLCRAVPARRPRQAEDQAQLLLTAGAFKKEPPGSYPRPATPPPRVWRSNFELLDGFFSQIVRGIAGERHKDEDGPRLGRPGAALGERGARRRAGGSPRSHPDEFRDRVDEEMGDDTESLTDYAARIDRRSASGRKVAILYALGAIYRGGSGTDPFSGELALGATPNSRAPRPSRRGRLGGRGRPAHRQSWRFGARLRSDPARSRASRGEEAGGRLDVGRRGLRRPLHRLAGDRIVAEEATITSFDRCRLSGKLASGRFQKELLGVTYDPLTRGANAELYSTLKPFDERELAVMRRRIDEVYGRFLDHVAAGRGLPRAKRSRGGRRRSRLDRRRRPAAPPGRRDRRPRPRHRARPGRGGDRARRPKSPSPSCAPGNALGLAPRTAPRRVSRRSRHGIRSSGSPAGCSRPSRATSRSTPSSSRSAPVTRPRLHRPLGGRMRDMISAAPTPLARAPDRFSTSCGGLFKLSAPMTTSPRCGATCRSASAASREP
ncbi:MAG: S49 family peptidase [Thermoanaerobaculia bacterium]